LISSFWPIRQIPAGVGFAALSFAISLAVHILAVLTESTTRNIVK